MMGAVAGLASREGVEVRGMEAAAVSYPGFVATWSGFADRRSGFPEHGAALLIAIDGPAGAGKSTVARAVAKRLGFTYLDSGAMYRCVALLSLAAPERRSPDDSHALPASSLACGGERAHRCSTGAT